MVAPLRVTYAVTFGGPETDGLSDVAIDRMGNVYTAGFVGEGAVVGGETHSIEGEERDGILASYDATGSLRWKRQFGGTGGSSSGFRVVIDPDGPLYLFGQYAGTTDFGGGPITALSRISGFLASYEADGTFRWLHLLPTGAGRLALDGAGNVFMAGQLRGTFDFGSGPLVANGQDVLIASYDPDGTLRFARLLGGDGDQSGSGLAVDPTGALLLAAFGAEAHLGGIDLGAPALQPNCIVAKLDPAGSVLWAEMLSSPTFNACGEPTLDSSSNVLFTVMYQDRIDVLGHTYASSDSWDSLFVSLGNDGEFRWAQTIGGEGSQRPLALVLDGAGRVLVAGDSLGSFLDIGGRSVRLLAGAFLATYASDGTFMDVIVSGGAGWPIRSRVDANESGQVALSGAYVDTLQFGDEEHPSAGMTDGYVALLNR